MQCEICGADITETNLALVEVEHAELPAETSGVATLTGQVCVACWNRLEQPPSSLLYRGRLLTLEDIYPLDMRPIAGADLERRAAADRVVVDDELARAEALKVKLNRYAVLTFNDPYSGDSVTVNRDDWEDPLEVAVAVVRAIKELRELDSSAVNEILDRAGFSFVPATSPAG